MRARSVDASPYRSHRCEPVSVAEAGVTGALRASSGSSRGATFGEHHRCPFRDAGGDPFGIPIGQAHAAVRLSLGDILRRRGAMDAVAVAGQIDPDRADRIVRPGPDREWLAGMNALE